eukprot:scaffold3791_cov137-Cylindrotheca_fusiformis.AAC.3
MTKTLDFPRQQTITNSAPMMPPSLVTTGEIQDIIDRSSTQQELFINLMTFAVDLICEDDFSQLSSPESKEPTCQDKHRNHASDKDSQED